MIRPTIALLALLILIQGCGYSFQGASTSSLHDIRSLAIPTVRNPSTHADLTDDLTNELVHHFAQTGGLKLTDVDQADAVLETDIKSVRIEGAARTSERDASASRRVIVEVQAQLVDRKEKKTLWPGGVFSARRTYPVSQDQSVLESNLSESLGEIARELAGKIHDQAVEDF